MEFKRQSIRTVGISLDESRRKRETQTLSLRKQNREELLAKRRRATTTIDSSNPVSDVQYSQQDFMQIIHVNKERIFTNDIEVVKSACEEFRKILSDENRPPINQVIEAGVVPRIVECLQANDKNLQYEALWCLTNIASGNHQQTEYLLSLGVVPIFLELLSSSNPKIKEQACWALGNIAGDCTEFRDLILSHDGISHVLGLFQGDKLKASLVRVAIWVLSNLCRGKPMPPFSMVQDVVPLVCKLIYSMDQEVLVDALWTLSFVSDGKDKRQRAVVEHNVSHRLVTLLGSNELHYLLPSLRVVGNLLSGENDTTQVVIDAGVIPVLKKLLNHEKHSVRKEACWGLSNILAGTSQQIQQVIDEDLIGKILDISYNDRFDVKKEAAWCIVNAVTGATYPQIVYFVNNNCLPAICSFLKIKDTSLIDMTLDAIEKTLKVGNKIASARNMPRNPYIDIIYSCGGLDTLESEMQSHDNDDISTKVERILTTYFRVEEDMSDQMEQRQYSFNVESQPTEYNF